ncbi:uncharacterized protein SAPINGB_P004575 [Magnusiomyces paraingens]|uniref:TBP-associated factor 6 n=1 Tax=Magnusiomyces paraingens TaxID=2606893 RepID=A0A5E8C2M7_9ASCO|nr:uncharacterized protein SAPINGB_P004575 [Saprochaete ingens]VVT55395.1 unnamed protein product [Saprochaete ingens]
MSQQSAASSIKYSHTLWSPSDTIRDVAEVLGISNLPDEVAKSLAMEVEYRIHEVVEQAVKFMRHSRRTLLTTADIGNAMRVMNVEPLYGYETTRSLNYKEAMVGPGQTLYYIDDDDVDFEKIINQPLPKIPRATNFTAHWLAIEGVQPAIPQNPLPSEVKAIPPQVRGSQVTHSVSALASDVEIKPLVKHVISKELQIYFDRVVEALLQEESESDNPSSLRNIALNSLRNDPGLHQLVPYLVQFVQEQISQNLKSSLSIVSTMLEVIHAMLQNPNIFIEPYIHQIMPCLLTPLLSKRVGAESKSSDSETLDETARESYAVRDFAASLVSSISEKYSDVYYSLKPRVTRTLLKGFMDVNRSVPSWYGSIVGIRGLGPEVVRVVIVGNLKAWYHGILPRIPSLADQKLLTMAIIDALRTLKKQVPTLLASEDVDGSPIIVPLSEEEKTQLKNLVGEKFYQILMMEKDAEEIARGLLI